MPIACIKYIHVVRTKVVKQEPILKDLNDAQDTGSWFHSVTWNPNELRPLILNNIYLDAELG